MEAMMCVGPNDVNGLFAVALQLLRRNCPFLTCIHLVTPEVAAVAAVVERLPAERSVAAIRIRHDTTVAGGAAATLPGWWRQQYIKLHADRVCEGEVFVCVGADTLVLEPIHLADLVRKGEPVLYYHRYDHRNRHLDFERERVKNVASLLQVDPARALAPGDFICDFFPMHRDHLARLRAHLDALHGEDALAGILSRFGPPRAHDDRFGEWSLYAVYLLDVLGSDGPLCFSPHWSRQVHSASDLQRPHRYDARIVHFAKEPGGTETVLSDLVGRGRLNQSLLALRASVLGAAGPGAASPSSG